jgi:hypothetical protein
MCFYVVYFPLILAGFPFDVIFVLFLFSCNWFLFLLVIMLGPLLLANGLRVCCFDADLWIVDVNVILTFRSRMMSFGLGFSTLSTEE